MRAEDVVLRFVDAINRADVDRLAALMTDDHVFVDSDGTRTAGRDVMREGWAGYFAMMADYRIAVAETYSSGATVVVVGTASGTYVGGGPPRPENRWSVPAAWRGVVKGDRVAEWQVFVNPEPIRAAMRPRATPEA